MRIGVVLGDITKQQVDAIVNAANSALSGGGGVDGAIHDAAGPELVRASRALAPCPAGDARITPGFLLPARWVIHAVGPVWWGGEQGEDQTLSTSSAITLNAAANAMHEVLAELQDTGDTTTFDAAHPLHVQAGRSLMEIMHLDHYLDFELRHGPRD